MKIFLLGQTGYLGSRISEYFLSKGYDLRAIKADVTNLEAVKKALKGIEGQVIINATGRTGPSNRELLSEAKTSQNPRSSGFGALRSDPDSRQGSPLRTAVLATPPNVDWCESHQEETYAVNVTGAINVAKVASGQGNYVVQIGSGCIFESPLPGHLLKETGKVGTELEGGSIHSSAGSGLCPEPQWHSNSNAPSGSRPACRQAGLDPAFQNDLYFFTEDDEPNFFGSFYSRTKAEAEAALKQIPSVCILRIRMPLSERPHPKNLLTKLLGYKKILNVPNSVTVIEDFLPFLERVIEKHITGVLNAVNPGVYRHSDILELYRKHVDPTRQFEYITLEQFEGMTIAKRSNCVLSTKKAEELGIAMPEIQGRLRYLVAHYKAKA